MWDPTKYLAYADERGRPFHDLVNRIVAVEPRHIVDLGCGPGNLTTTLAERWPQATVIGLDSSTTMIAEARKIADGGSVRFSEADLRTWEPDTGIDVLVSNATLQWVPEHVDLFDRFVSWLNPGGSFAFQVPGNFTAPSHRILAELRLSDRWRHRLGDGAERHLAVGDPAEYAAELLARGCEVDAWETTYVHLLSGPDPVYEWVSGTGLRPVLSILDADEQSEFAAAYKARLRDAYPAFTDVGLTALPFRRIFVVARKGSSPA